MTDFAQSELAPLVGAAAPVDATVGARTLVLDSVDSTNIYAAELVRKGEFVEGQAVFADRQTDGRGRMGRSWHCPDAAGVLLSVILTPDLVAAYLPAITAIGALALADAVESVAPVEARIRWPNDVVVDHAKIAGVLARIEKTPDGGRCFVLGVGLNVNIAREAFPPDIPPATSLQVCAGRPVSRLDVAKALLRSLDEWYRRLKAGDFGAIEARLRERSSLLGREITVECRGETITGVASDISLVDGLTIILPDGSARACHESVTSLAGHRRT